MNNVSTLPNTPTTGRGAKAGIRLSIEPLEGALARYEIDPEHIEGRLNNAIRKARFNGFITLTMADEIACNVLRMHPFEVWGQEYEDKAWFDMHDADETGAMAEVVAFPTPVPMSEPVRLLAVA